MSTERFRRPETESNRARIEAFPTLSQAGLDDGFLRCQTSKPKSPFGFHGQLIHGLA